jgi:hypothetical protein
MKHWKKIAAAVVVLALSVAGYTTFKSENADAETVQIERFIKSDINKQLVADHDDSARAKSVDCVGTKRCIIVDEDGGRWTATVTKGHDGFMYEVDGQLR